MFGVDGPVGVSLITAWSMAPSTSRSSDRVAWPVAVKPFQTPTFDGSKVEVFAMTFDRDGNLWVASRGKGLYRIHGDVVDHYGRTDGLSSDSVNLLFEDREGILWAGTSNGIDSFRDPSVTTFSSSVPAPPACRPG